MQETQEFIKLADRITNAVTRLPAKAAVIGVNFSKQRFLSQNWVNHISEPWKKRKTSWKKNNDRGRAILVKSSRLKRSIRTISVTSHDAIIGTDVPYAPVHNFGFRGRVKQNVRSYTRLKRSGGKTVVKAHDRHIYQNIPKRQFIGPSVVFDKQLTRMMTTEITKAFK